ncbi:hypothetical protein BSZ39_12865 [Bowdeniella nasicola]|uniref:Uncharacterized protein n=1 Tax=Bowdeniella nasicola TaxID=208480 RepID=A0A1Q5PU09_9ACTO|nr:hypothetical protein [Bowdeniella nasicola]OKL51044.1 hypothetical protein BSZ39_12865 [Bowdeniella nasicola]
MWDNFNEEGAVELGTVELDKDGKVDTVTTADGVKAELVDGAIAFMYSRDLPAKADMCMKYTNKASVIGKDDSATVEVCGPTTPEQPKPKPEEPKPPKLPITGGDVAPAMLNILALMGAAGATMAIRRRAES